MEFSEVDKKLNLYDFTKKYKPEGWEDFIKDADDELLNISEILEKEKEKGYRIVPDMENIFKVFYLLKPENVKVIIWGQDPYHQILYNGKARAQGLSFSVTKEDEVPVSLVNIYKEIINCYPETPVEKLPKHGDLTPWVNQGVLLLNSCLTCRAAEANSHGKYNLWHPIISKMLNFISKYNKDVIHVLWGKESQKLEKMISKNYKIMLMGPHPSGLSAYRGFFGCGHFKTINELLIKQGKEQIIWI
jgi:uracil-DNA glycosylase